VHYGAYVTRRITHERARQLEEAREEAGELWKQPNRTLVVRCKKKI